MMSELEEFRENVIVDRSNFDQLFEALIKRGFKVVGPTVRYQAIVYDELTSANDLPLAGRMNKMGGNSGSKNETIARCSILRLFQQDTNAAVIGEVVSTSHGSVTMMTKIGVTRIVDMLSGEQLPRIC